MRVSFSRHLCQIDSVIGSFIIIVAVVLHSTVGASTGLDSASSTTTGGAIVQEYAIAEVVIILTVMGLEFFKKS